MIRPLLVLAVVELAVGTVALQWLVPPDPVLIWNASPSAPLGLYRVTAAHRPRRGDLVAIRTPEPLAGFLAENGYLPARLPLLKHVAAVAGQRVCRDGRQLTIDGQTSVRALGRDRRGRPLPVWAGCYQLGPSEFFALNPTAPDSLDGRYFGPLPTSAVIGIAHPLWLRGSL